MQFYKAFATDLKLLCIQFNGEKDQQEFYLHHRPNIYLHNHLPNIYVFKVNNKNTRKRCDVCSKLTIKHQNDVNDVFLVFLLLTLDIFNTFL